MTTEKIEYGPDYKSEKQRFLERAERSARSHRSFSEVTKMNVVDYKPSPSVETERARLERAVIEAAKAYGGAAQAVEDYMKGSSDRQTSDAGWQSLRDLESKYEELMLEAIRPLLEFEATIGAKA